MSKTKEMLLYDLSSVYDRLFKVLKEEALVGLPAFILIGALLAFLFGMDFGGVAKRSFIAMLAIFSFSWFFISSGDIGFRIGDRLLSSNNHILKSWTEATSVRSSGFKNTSKKNTKSEDRSWFDSLSQDYLGFFIWVVSNFALWFVKISFTAAYYLPLIMLPVVAAISILPTTSKAIEGSMLTAVWVGVTPIVIVVMLEILNGILVIDNVMVNASWISKAIMSIMFSLYLVGSFTLGYKMIGQTGIGEGVSQIGQSFSTGMVTGGISLIKTKFLGAGKKLIFSQNGKSSLLKKLTVDPVKNQKNKLYQKSQHIRNANPETAGQVMSDGDNKWNKAENRTHKLSAASNPLKTLRDKRDRVRTAKQAINDGNNSKVIDRKSTNTTREEQGKQKINLQGNSYGNDYQSTGKKIKRESTILNTNKILDENKNNVTKSDSNQGNTKIKDMKWDMKPSTTNTKNKRI